MAQLKEELKSRGLDTTGLKPQLVARLLEALDGGSLHPIDDGNPEEEDEQ